MYRLTTVISNVVWLLSVLPAWLRFQFALRYPGHAQRKVLQTILSKNAGSEALHNKHFHQMPTRNYEELWPDIRRIMQGAENILTSQPPLLLEPTGGSSAGTKLIPYTRALKKEFQRAIDPWIAGLFLKWPSLLLGRHYWCITPSTVEPRESVIPVGFDSDAAYLGRFQRYLASRIFAVPPEIARSENRKHATFQTLVHLLDTPDLRFISVWHPSMLTHLLETLKERFDELLLSVTPHRARKLRLIGCNPSLIWKKLKVISCWAGASCNPWIDQLKILFPQVVIQPKGLVATEGITSIPLGSTLDVAAIRSHYFEFECEDSLKLIPLCKVERGQTYHLILTTGGGLYRYRTNDRIEVTGFRHRTPCLRFLTRNNMTSDLFGEKISQAQAERICGNLPCAFTFAMIAPEPVEQTYRYALYIEAETVPPEITAHLENGLCENYHYRHARNLGQLEQAVVHRVDNGTRKVRCYMAGCGLREGDIKLTALRTETHWSPILQNGGAE